MNITLDLERRRLLPVPHAKALTLLDDLETTLGRFPNLKGLTRLGPDQYRWDLRTMGVRIARIAHDLSYAAHYRVDREAGAIRWKPLPGHGNALIGGEIRIADNGDDTAMVFRIDGVMHDVPVPLLYRPLAGPFIVDKLGTLIDRYLAATATALAGAPEPVATTGKKNR